MHEPHFLKILKVQGKETVKGSFCFENKITFLIYILQIIIDVAGSSDGKELACNAGDWGLIPRQGRFPGEGNGYPLQYSCLGYSHGQKSLVEYSPLCRKELDMTEWLSTHWRLINVFWDKIRVIFEEHCKCPKCHSTIYIKMINSMLYRHKRPEGVEFSMPPLRQSILLGFLIQWQ